MLTLSLENATYCDIDTKNYYSSESAATEACYRDERCVGISESFTCADKSKYAIMRSHNCLTTDGSFTDSKKMLKSFQG